MIRYSGPMEVALAVKAVMDTLITEKDREIVYCEAVANCREQGLHIIGQAGRCSFSECRSGDSIVVYPGKQGDFGFTNLPKNDDVWENRRFFDYGQYYKVALFILRHITSDDIYA